MRRRAIVFCFLVVSAPQAVAADAPVLTGSDPPAGAIWLETVDLSAMVTDFGRGTAGTTVTGNPLSIGGVAYQHGVGTHANSEMTVDLAGQALRFVADAGIDDDLKCLERQGVPKLPAVVFKVFVDGKLAAKTGVVRTGPAAHIDVNLKGAKAMRLVAEKQKEAHYNHVSWAGAALFMVAPGAPPRTVPGKTPVAAAPVTTPLSADEAAIIAGNTAPANGLWIESLDLKKGRTNPVSFSVGKTPEGKPLRLGTTLYSHGISSANESELRIDLAGSAKRFLARAGIDHNLGCGKAMSAGTSRFEVWVDGRRTADLPTVHGYDRPLDLSVDLTGAKSLVLISMGEGGVQDWAGAILMLDPRAKTKPITVTPAPPAPAVIAKRRPDEVRINGARVVGTTPGRPFLFLIPATGKPPLRFEAAGLPAGLTLDPATGIITGTVGKPGTTEVSLTVIAANGKTARKLAIVAGTDLLARTPPMGWNSWNVWGLDVDDAKVKAAADAFVATGLAANGFQYINIDDGWEEGRDGKGNILTNKKFSDMAALTGYVHGKGLRMGIYSSPGPKTCGGYEGSYKHEAQDAATYARWGFDYLKYDWCSYGGLAKDASPGELQKPYVLMAKALRKSSRDIVFSLCQYGTGAVWTWGRKVGGNLWRTTGDITDTWGSLSDIGFGQNGKEIGSGPGGWNDPDMLIVGKVGWSASIRNTRLAPNEQVTHITLWAMLAAPLLLGNDLAQIDSFTLDLIENPEVVDVDQDALGKQAVRKATTGPIEIWARPLADGTTAVALFNRGQATADGVVKWSDVALSGEQPVRDLWSRTDVGRHEGSYTAPKIASHGAALLKIGTPRPE